MNIKTQLPTIAAIATARGSGGVGIVRVSGANAKSIAENITSKKLKPRVATFTNFSDKNNNILDSGLAIFFNSPNSYTGEDVLELQAHGGSVILSCILEEVLSLGAVMAEPGEFTKRAYLNNKIDLAQAEAVADLINATSTKAALAATNTLSGVFSEKINKLSNDIVMLRVFVEAAIDFPEEEIDFLQDKNIITKLNNIKQTITEILTSAKSGTRLVDGINAVILGKPNAGKSSLLNALCKDDVAIVTDIPGTTRDIINNSIDISGLTVNLIDTAGIRQTADIIEQEGISRALNKSKNAELILLVVDVLEEKQLENNSILSEFGCKILEQQTLITIINKIDKVDKKPAIEKISNNEYKVYLSAKNQQGINLLEEIIQEISGVSNNNEGMFSARKRHINAINNCLEHIVKGEAALIEFNAGEILAEELREANKFLATITGEFNSDDLLGKIFSEFCIGK